MSKPEINPKDVEIFTALAAGALLILEKVDQAKRAEQAMAERNESRSRNTGDKEQL